MLSSTESRSHRTGAFGGKASFLFRMFALLMAATSTSSVCAEDALQGLFPGVKFSRHLGNPGADLFASAYARIKSSGKEYVALTYYEPYPNAPGLHYVSYALLELAGTGYKLVLDYPAADGDGSGVEFPSPFLYTVEAQSLIVFPSCYRGCGYTFFRLGTTPTQVTLQRFDGLGAAESYSGRGDEYRFDASGLSATFHLMRPGDAMCCLTGGTLDVVYELRGSQFQISRVERKVLAGEAQ